MTQADHIGEPCTCPQCHQAGVAHLEVRRDPYSGAWLHGYDLRRWYEARDRARGAWRQALEGKGIPAVRRIAEQPMREPGEDD